MTENEDQRLSSFVLAFVCDLNCFKEQSLFYSGQLFQSDV